MSDAFGVELGPVSEITGRKWMPDQVEVDMLQCQFSIPSVGIVAASGMRVVKAISIPQIQCFVNGTRKAVVIIPAYYGELRSRK